MTPSVVLVSKPLGPPWRDGSSKLVVELLEGLLELEEHRLSFRVFGKGTFQPPDKTIDVIRLTSTGRARNFEYLLRLFVSSGTVCNFFFAPHLAAVTAAKVVCASTGARPIQTIPSQPRSFDHARQLCFGERIVAQSTWTAERLVTAGVDSSRVKVIHPPLRRLQRPETGRIEAARSRLGVSSDQKVIVFPGDAEPGGGLGTFAEAMGHVVPHHRNMVFVVACRAKTRRSKGALQRACRVIEKAGALSALRCVGEVEDFQAMLAAADLCVLPASSLYAKVDFPYAILEAMSLGVPVIVGRGTPLDDLVDLGGARAVPRRAPRALATAIVDILENGEKRDALASRGRAVVEELCDPVEAARRYRNLYLETDGD